MTIGGPNCIVELNQNYFWKIVTFYLSSALFNSYVIMGNQVIYASTVTDTDAPVWLMRTLWCMKVETAIWNNQHISGTEIQCNLLRDEMLKWPKLWRKTRISILIKNTVEKKYLKAWCNLSRKRFPLWWTQMFLVE